MTSSKQTTNQPIGLYCVSSYLNKNVRKTDELCLSGSSTLAFFSVTKMISIGCNGGNISEISSHKPQHANSTFNRERECRSKDQNVTF